MVETGRILARLFSNFVSVSSVASGNNWRIKPPAAATFKSGFTRTPKPTLEGVCSEV